MTSDARMMNDIIEEPEKDSLLGLRPEAQVVSVMSAKAKASELMLASHLCYWQGIHVQTASSDTIKFYI